MAAQLELRRNLEELRVALEGVTSLNALIPFCSTCALNIVIPVDPTRLHTVTAGLNQALASTGWSEKEMMEVDLALQEALANAIRHGCKNDPQKQVQCCVSFDAKGELVIVVTDPGTASIPPPFPALSKATTC